MKRTWPFGLKEEILGFHKDYYFPGKLEDLMTWYAYGCLGLVMEFFLTHLYNISKQPIGPGIKQTFSTCVLMLIWFYLGYFEIMSHSLVFKST